jgi:hypothetical protein
VLNFLPAAADDYGPESEPELDRSMLARWEFLMPNRGHNI